jgi:hypothetical protein
MSEGTVRAIAHRVFPDAQISRTARSRAGVRASRVAIVKRNTMNPDHLRCRVGAMPRRWPRRALSR